jgi:hypothetical protein
MSLGEISFVVACAGIVPYAWQIMRGKVRPERASWLVWTVILGLGLFGYRRLGAGDAAWFLWGDFTITGIVFLLSLWRGVGGWTKLDKVCLAIAFLGVVLWQLSSSLLFILIGTIIADLMGVIPTLKKALRDPASENAATFVASAVAAAMGFVAVGVWNWQLLFLPMYLFLANAVVAQTILVGQYHLRQGAS